MKRIRICFLLLAILLFINSHIFAQHAQFGIKGGLNMASLHSSSSSSPDAKASLYAGGLAHIHFTNHFAMQPEIYFSGQGAVQRISGNDINWRLNYINVPVLFQYMVGDGFRLQTGPQLGLLASANVKSGDSKTDVMDEFKTADVSWSFGGSYVTKTGLGFDARYNLGLTDISKNSSSELYNRVFQFGLFYQFNHPK